MKDLLAKIRLVAFDFDGVFTDNMVYVLENGTEAVRCFRSDGLGLQKLEQLGIETVIISTEANPVVSARAHKLKIRCVQDCRDKRAALESIAKESGISLAEVAFVGNDINDLPCLTCVHFPSWFRTRIRMLLPTPFTALAVREAMVPCAKFVICLKSTVRGLKVQKFRVHVQYKPFGCEV